MWNAVRRTKYHDCPTNILFRKKSTVHGMQRNISYCFEITFKICYINNLKATLNQRLTPHLKIVFSSWFMYFVHCVIIVYFNFIFCLQVASKWNNPHWTTVVLQFYIYYSFINHSASNLADGSSSLVPFSPSFSIPAIKFLFPPGYPRDEWPSLRVTFRNIWWPLLEPEKWSRISAHTVFLFTVGNKKKFPSS